MKDEIRTSAIGADTEKQSNLQVATWRPGAVLKELCTDEARRHVLRLAVESKEPHAMEVLNHELAHLLRFREATVRGMASEKKIVYLEKYVTAARLQTPLASALITFHFEERAELLCSFLDLWGVEHDDHGRIEGSPKKTPAPAEVTRTISVLREKFDPRDIAVYLATAGLATIEWQDVLWPAIASLIETRPQEDGPAPALPTPRLPEDSPGFTTLDQLLITTVVASLGETEGALSRDQVYDLIEEVIHLSSSRHRSYFHRGFLETLAGDSNGDHFPEENAARRAWYLAGRVMGLARKGDHAEIRELFRNSLQDFRELMSEAGAQPAAGMVAERIFNAFWGDVAFEQAASSITPKAAASAGPRFLARLLSAARELFLKRRLAPATLVLDLFDSAVRSLGPGDVPPESVMVEARRRRAQILRAQGHFELAGGEFAKLVDNAATAPRSDVLADLALCRASFKWLSDAGVPRQKADVPDQFRRLGSVEKELRAAAAADGRPTNAVYLLGVFTLLGQRYEEAAGHLENAYAGMSQRDEFYPEALLKCRLYYALSILLSLQEPLFGVARDLLRELGAETFPDWPEWLLAEALQSAKVAGSEGVALAEWAAERFPESLATFLDTPGFIARSGLLTSKLRLRALDTERALDTRWVDCQTLLEVSRERTNVDGAHEALDALEDLAGLSPSMADRFEVFLVDEANYMPFWTWEEVQRTRTRLLEAKGKLQEAAGLLVGLIHRSLSQDNVEAARGARERISSYRISFDCPEVDGRLSALETKEADEEGGTQAALAAGGRIRVLFVGGNETQERYDEEVRMVLRVSAPRVDVDFVHPGWTSNWGTVARRVNELMEVHDVMVLMQFVRTEFGRRVRDDVGKGGKRWFPCTGHGRDSIIGAIVRAAVAVQA